MIDTFSETTKLDWHKTLECSIIEFFNVLSYAKEKTERQKKMLEKYRTRQ